MPLADISTPNRFELAWLAGADLPDNKAVMQAALHAGPATMLVTSAHPMLAGGTGNLLITSRARASCRASPRHRADQWPG